jgi:hypothetical protein
MDASYYRALAATLSAYAEVTEDKMVAARFRKRAEEYLLIARTLDEAPLPSVQRRLLKHD